MPIYFLSVSLFPVLLHITIEASVFMIILVFMVIPSMVAECSVWFFGLPPLILLCSKMKLKWNVKSEYFTVYRRSIPLVNVGLLEFQAKNAFNSAPVGKLSM